MEVLELFKDTVAVVGPLLGGGGVWAYMRSRASAPATIIESQASMVDALAAQTKMILDESAKDRKELKNIVVTQSKRLTKVEAEVLDCTKRHADCESNVARLNAEIENLMRKGKVATYPHGGANVAD